MTKNQIRDIALQCGFKLKKQPNGEEDLNPYVYHFVSKLMGLYIGEIMEDMEAYMFSEGYCVQTSECDTEWVIPLSDIQECISVLHTKFKKELPK